VTERPYELQVDHPTLGLGDIHSYEFKVVRDSWADYMTGKGKPSFVRDSPDEVWRPYKETE
jgi:hypothetical protein